MPGLLKKIKKKSEPERLTEAYEVRAFRDESEEPVRYEAPVPEVAHPEPGELQGVKDRIMGHGEQTVLPDDCQFGDNDICYVEA